MNWKQKFEKLYKAKKSIAFSAKKWEVLKNYGFGVALILITVGIIIFLFEVFLKPYAYILLPIVIIFGILAVIVFVFVAIVIIHDLFTNPKPSEPPVGSENSELTPEQKFQMWTLLRQFLYEAIKSVADNSGLIPPSSVESLNSSNGANYYVHGSTVINQYSVLKKSGEKVDINEIKLTLGARFMQMYSAGVLIGLIAGSTGTKIICPIGLAYVRDTGSFVEIGLFLRNPANPNLFENNVNAGGDMYDE